MLKLPPEELVALIRSVFPRFETDRALAILVDVPREAKRDNPAWKERRAPRVRMVCRLERGARQTSRSKGWNWSPMPTWVPITPTCRKKRSS